MENHYLTSAHQLNDFWDMPADQREGVLLQAIQETHAWHYPRNNAYRRTVAARGVGETIETTDLPRLLRPTAQTFKSYIDILGDPFANYQPGVFLNWLADQLSIDLPRQRFEHFRSRYGSLESLLKDIEARFSEYGLEILTSSGTSGRSTIMVRDQDGIDKTVESFYLAFQRYLGLKVDHRAIFVMPQHTRIAMVRMATFSVKRVGLPPERVHFTIPFPAYPDQVRIRAGRSFHFGWSGTLERRLLNPFMNWANDRLATPRAVKGTLSLLEAAEAHQDKVLLFGGWIHLHNLAQNLLARGRQLRLAPGSLIGSGGGMKELYPFTPAQIREDLARAIVQSDGQPVPIRDTYGMAEGNWAAMQCQQGNYHIPPWLYAVTLDENDQFQSGAEATGLLAFFDPFGGGRLFPAFFKTADRMNLVNSAGNYDASKDCACGEKGTYITRESIQRVDLVDEAGCAAQL